MKKVLLCPPTYYDIEYEINPWMHVENKVDKEKAQKEYEELKRVYTELGAEVLEIAPQPDLPDLVYIANCGFPKGDTFIRSNFKYPERKREAEVGQAYFETLGFTIVTLPEHISFEGQGDLLLSGNKYFFGWGKRSDQEAKEFLSQQLKAEIIDFELRDPYFYHLDMSLGPLDLETVVINERSFKEEDVLKIYDAFPNVITTSPEDNQVMACNLVVIERTVVVAAGITSALKNKIERFGFEVREVAMEEYRKGGGSVKCSTLEFF